MLRRNVLIFHAGALGDFVMSWPLAMAVGRIFAQSRVIYVTHGEKGKLAEGVLRVESVEIESAWRPLWSETPALAEPQQKMLNGAAFIFSFVSNGDDVWARNVRLLAPEAQLVALQTRPPANFEQHASQFLVEQLSSQVVVATAVEQMLRSIADRGVGASPSAGEYVLLHPGSGSPEKNWPLERYISLAEGLNRDGHEVRATIGEVEAERWSKNDIAMLEGVARVTRPATYVELWREIAKAKLVVTNDTGPGHLAGIVGVPTLAVYGSTNPAVWKPLGPRVEALSGEPLGKLDVETVFAKVKSIVGVKKKLK